MAKTIRTKVYQFQELSESAKENAIISNLTINTDYDWWDGVYEDASNVDIKITHFDIDINSIDIEMENYSHTANLIVKNHGKKCETYSVARSFLEGLDRLEKQKEYNEETEETIYYEFHRRIKKCYLNLLRQDWEYLESEEGIKQTFEANGYWFTQSGEIFNY